MTVANRLESGHHARWVAVGQFISVGVTLWHQFHALRQEEFKLVSDVFLAHVGCKVDDERCRFAPHDVCVVARHELRSCDVYEVSPSLEGGIYLPYVFGHMQRGGGIDTVGEVVVVDAVGFFAVTVDVGDGVAVVEYLLSDGRDAGGYPQLRQGWAVGESIISHRCNVGKVDRSNECVAFKCAGAYLVHSGTETDVLVGGTHSEGHNLALLRLVGDIHL